MNSNNKKHLNVLAKGEPFKIPLYYHLCHVKSASEKFAKHLNYDVKIAGIGGVLHDIGKCSTIFQERLFLNQPPETIYRHEISSLFYLSLFDKEIHPFLIEMIISHHKSIIRDIKDRGLIDLIENYGSEKIFDLHIKDFENWGHIGTDILGCFGISEKKINYIDAKNNFLNVVDYVYNKLDFGYSVHKGLLMGSDHFASTINYKTNEYLEKCFMKPNLSFYLSENRKNELYPLSLIDSNSNRKHTILTAPTGSGKTDFLLRRCKNRVFYTLPFMASINSMYYRIKNDLSEENLDIRVLHSSSKITENGNDFNLKLIQSHFGSSIKILTPHQMFSIVFGINGYESKLLDYKNSDIILDEIHTYSDKIQSIVLKTIEILKFINCSIHIGTATLPSSLYKKILDVLGKENTYEVKLDSFELENFNRHIIHKHDSFDEQIFDLIKKRIKNNEKILIVKNRVRESQLLYGEIINRFPDIKKMLIHSRFKRGDRKKLENDLILFNNSTEPCIVVSTQVVEVSLDISFDFMITDCSPIDSLIQRFGRINRKRKKNNKSYKDIIIIKPPDLEREAMPYSLDILKKTYENIQEGLLEEKNIQNLIDTVYPDINVMDLNDNEIFKNGDFSVLYKLEHRSKSTLFEELEIDTINLILDIDEDKYINSNNEDKILLEIPINYFSIQNLGLFQLNKKHNMNCFRNPYIISSDYYSKSIGLNMNMIKNNIVNII